MKNLFSYSTYYFFIVLIGLFLFGGAQYAHAYMAPMGCQGPYVIGQMFNATPDPAPKINQLFCSLIGDTPVPPNLYRCEEDSANNLYCRHYINLTTDYYTCTYFGRNPTIGANFYSGYIFDNCTFSLVPPSISFTAPASINLGQSATLSWNVANATTCTASGGWSGTRALSGSEAQTPTTTTTYTLSCTGSTTVSQSRTVTVIIPDTTPPSTPGNLAALAASTSQINLTWNASTDTGGSLLAGYRIERCTGTGCSIFTEIATSPVASYSNAGLAPSTSYTYRVRAYDGAGNTSSYSNTDSDTTWTPADTTPPSAPVLSETASTSIQISLAWTPSTDNVGGVGLAGYRVYRGGILIFTTGSTVLTYDNGGLMPSTTYSYYVSAYDNAGNAAPSNTINITTPAIPDTTPPVFIFNSPGSTLLAGTTSAILGGRTTDENATNENATCRFSTPNDLPFASMTLFSSDLLAPVINHTQPITGLTDGTVYTYYVKCRDGAGNTNPTGFPYMFQVDSPLPDITPPLISNGTPSGTLPSGTQTATMSVVTDDDAYCRYSTNSNTAYGSMTNNLASSDLKTHTAPLSGLTNGSSYTYYVRCENTPGGYANTSGYPISFVISFPMNMNPMALIVITPSTSGTAPFTISANGSGSYDSDGTITQYIWDWGDDWGDGSPNMLGVPGASHTYATAGTYTLLLRVIDNQGGSGTTSQTITVSGVPPPPPPPVNFCTAECTHNSDCTAPNICGPSKFCIAQSGGLGPNRFDGYLSRTDGSMSQPTPATFPAGTASVIMSMKTDTNVNAECQYSTVGGTLYGASAMKTFANTGTAAHSVTLTGLQSMIATPHIYYVRCRDLASGIVNDNDLEISFIIGAPIVVSGPNDYTCLINADYVRNNIPHIFDICVPR